MDYENILYEKLPSELRYLIYDYLQPIHLSFEIKTSLIKYGHIIKSPVFEKYIEKRMVADFLGTLPENKKKVKKDENYVPREILAKIYRKYNKICSTSESTKTQGNLSGIFLLYHYFSAVTFDIADPCSRYEPGTFDENEMYNDFLYTLFNYEVIEETYTDKYEGRRVMNIIKYNEEIYNKNEVLMILKAICGTYYIYRPTPCMDGKYFEQFEIYDVLSEFIDIVAEQKPKIISLLVHHITNYEVKNSEKMLQQLFKKVMERGILSEVLKRADFPRF